MVSLSLSLSRGRRGKRNNKCFMGEKEGERTFFCWREGSASELCARIDLEKALPVLAFSHSKVVSGDTFVLCGLAGFSPFPPRSASCMINIFEGLADISHM